MKEIISKWEKKAKKVKENIEFYQKSAERNKEEGRDSIAREMSTKVENYRRELNIIRDFIKDLNSQKDV